MAEYASPIAAGQLFWLTKAPHGEGAAFGFSHDSDLFTFCETSGKEDKSFGSIEVMLLTFSANN